MNRPHEFTTSVKQRALTRQKFKCASCGTSISRLGIPGAATHRYGESAQAHHIKHIKFGGSDMIQNCVIICQSCHYSLHEGGNYRYGTVIGNIKDFPHYNG